MGKKFSIVTACYNSEKYIEECILSIKSQRYTNYEHIIVDGGSKDGTLDIIRKYEGSYPMKWISEPDQGMYDAICKGFRMATGDIYSWLNSDDIYMPWTLSTVAKAMDDGKIQWCTGRPTYLTPEGSAFLKDRTIGAIAYHQKDVARGYMDSRIMGFVQQESTFWSAELWLKSNEVIKQYRLAGDYWLWRQFAKYQPLYTLNTILAAFRQHPDQQTSTMGRYYNELPKLTKWEKFLVKSKLIFLKYVVCRPANKAYLIQIEKL